MLWCSQELKDDEFLYRRISHQYYDAGNSLPVAAVAFRPRAEDTDGISFYRAKYVPLCVAAVSPKQPNKHFYVSRLLVRDLRGEGMRLDVDPTDKAHVLVTNLNYSNLRGQEQSEWQVKMAQQLCKVLDPQDAGKMRAQMEGVLCWLRRVLC